MEIKTTVWILKLAGYGRIKENSQETQSLLIEAQNNAMRTSYEDW